jgi:hypothetical protein
MTALQRGQNQNGYVERPESSRSRDQCKAARLRGPTALALELPDEGGAHLVAKTLQVTRGFANREV